MPSDIGARMSVTGIAGFKSAMTQGKSAVKALDAELKLSTAQFKASGDAEQYMADRSRILAQQITAQEGVVQNATRALESMAAQGVDKASTAYTQMQAALAKARTDLVNLQTAAGETGQELEQVADSGRDMADSLQSIDKMAKLKELGDSLSAVDDVLTSMLTKIVTIGRNMWGGGRDAAEWADELSTNAVVSGLDVETYQRWEHAADKIDSSIEDIISGVDKLTKKTSSAKDGIAIIETETQQWAIELRDQTGEMRDQMDVFWEFIEILQSVENETERNTIAQEYFGKSYRELLPLIEQGRGAWDDAAAEASVVTQENVNKLTALNDKLEEMDQKWQATKMTMLAQLAPAFEKVADALEYVMGLLQQWAESEDGQKTLASMGDSIAELIKNVATGDIFQKMFDGVTEALEKMASFLESITSGDIIKGLYTIAGIFATIKLSSATVKGLSLMHSLGIFGGGAAASGAAAGGASGTAAAGVGVGAVGALAAIGETALTAGGMAGGVYLFAKGLEKVNKEIERGYNDTDFASGTKQYDTEGNGLFNWRGYMAKTGKELRYGSDIANAAIRSPQEFLWWDAENGSGSFGNFNQNVNDAYIKLGEALAKGFISESEYYQAESQLDMAQQLYSAFVHGNNEFDVYGFKDYEHKLNALTGGSAESGVEEYAEFSAIISGILNDVDKLTEGINENGEKYRESGAELGAQLTEGALEQTAAAFSVGAALASAFISGAGSVRPTVGGADGSTIYNSSYVNSVSFVGAMSMREMAEGYREFINNQQMGYGG